MRRIALLTAIATIVVTAGACGGDDPSRATVTLPTTTVPAGRSPSGSETVTPSGQAPTAVPLPPGTPAAFDRDAAPSALDASELIPPGTDVEATWITDDPEAIVIAYTKPGGDPFRADRGTIVWRRSADAPAWRAAAWFPTSAETGVLGVDGIVADVTGDGLQDVLFTAFTGGSGACARWSVIDVDAADQVYARNLCDGRVAPSVDPVGLSIEQAVYRVGDPHCCPSAFKTTVLTYDGTWTVASKDVRAAA
jgi:hypothetical protein